MQLRVPGPTPVPREVVDAMSAEMINHRGPEFANIIATATAGLKRCFQTENDLFILTSSGTGGLEAAIVNTLSPGDHVLGVTIGAFGNRFADIAETYGARVTRLKSPLGEAADPDKIRQALEANPSVKAVLVTHNETSTGVTNDLEAISAVVRQFDKLLLVDGVSSVGSIDLRTDQWGCDVVVSASQKGWMLPPGLAFVSFSQRAWEAQATAKMPRVYWDFALAKKYLERGQTPWTPAVSVFFGLVRALELIEAEGLPQVFARHARVARRAREGVRSLGLELLVKDERYASNTVTAVKVPAGVDAARLLRLLREDHGVVLAGGQEELSGKIFRIGHLGKVEESDIDAVLAALRAVLPVVTTA